MGTFIAAAGKPRAALSASHRPQAEGRGINASRRSTAASLSQGTTGRRHLRSGQLTTRVACRVHREPRRISSFHGRPGKTPLHLSAAAAGDSSSLDGEGEANDASPSSSSSSSSAAAAAAAAEATPLVSSPKESRTGWGAMAAELGEVMRFSLPAVGIFLVNPLMTLVDTAFLGAGPAAEQAALNPSGAILDYPIILLSFLAVGTTSLVAQNPGSEQNTRDVLRPALCLGLLLGVLLLAFTQLGTPQILTSLGVSGDVHEAAMTYIGIRALFCPLVLVCSIAQSAYLASKDVYTPLKLVIISGFINAAGDLLLVGKFGMGVAGAAWATVASQFFLTAGLLVGLHRVGKLPSLLPLPKLEEYAPFSAFAKSITLVNLLKVMGFTSITYYASTYLSTEHLAAQQVLVSIFILLTLISQPLLQCCQTFLPSLLPGGANADIAKAKSTVTAIFAAALGLGLACGILGTLVTLFGHHIFTADPVIVGYMNGAVLSILFCHIVSPIALSVDAVLVAARDLDALCWIQAVGLATLLGFMSVATSMGMGLSAIWLAYGTHLLSRLALCYWRMRKIPGLA